ncbi:hypothetical protein FXB40_10585 [Bradyrhizobium rifense]|uniref:Uncharacterized protein n=1 Tax=Bradyrhizobium rifense TaxID=515499 RepID=A0A5D3KLK7_9BRAD|nr:hypothetical protein FXB40_10585 [Bradyrhizobium rifense]
MRGIWFDFGETSGLSSSLRAERSNPESLSGKTLDCFAALAMTEYGVRRRDARAPCPTRPTRPSAG